MIDKILVSKEFLEDVVLEEGCADNLLQQALSGEKSPPKEMDKTIVVCCEEFKHSNPFSVGIDYGVELDVTCGCATIYINFCPFCGKEVERND